MKQQYAALLPRMQLHATYSAMTGPLTVDLSSSSSISIMPSMLSQGDQYIDCSLSDQHQRHNMHVTQIIQSKAKQDDVLPSTF